MVYLLTVWRWYWYSYRSIIASATLVYRTYPLPVFAFFLGINGSVAAIIPSDNCPGFYTLEVLPLDSYCRAARAKLRNHTFNSIFQPSSLWPVLPA